MTTTLVPAGAMFLCGTGGCDTVRYLRCTACGWTCVDPITYIGEDGQLPLDIEPEHTELDCRRNQREHPKPTPAVRNSAQLRAHTAFKRIHERHAPARLVRRHGVLTCPRCGFQP